MNSSQLAPISVLVYDRINHFKQCIESLLSNREAKDSVLYVFSDAAKPGDESKIQAVRGYAGTITGFKEVKIYAQQTNDHAKNARDLESIPLKLHGRVIVLEDDNIVSPYFLRYMNDALELYEDDHRIIGISGYSPPVGQHKITSSQVYLSHFYSGWGHATWSHKPYFKFLNSDKPYADMIANNLRYKVRGLHPKLHHSLKKMDEGTHTAGDQKLSYYMIRHGLFQIRPVHSLVKNIGHDGSGVHCGISDRFDIEPYSERCSVHISNFKYYPILDKRTYRYFYPRQSIFKRIRNKLRLISKLVVYWLNWVRRFA